MKQLFVTICFLALAPFVFGQITGTGHDFSGATWNQPAAGKCNVCHTPHNAITTVNDAPLWNHAVSNPTYQVYSSGTMQAVVSSPTGNSRLCLSCHDNTIEVGGGLKIGDIGGGYANVGTNLSDDHPISFTYNSLLATQDLGLKDPAIATGIGTLHINQSMLFGTNHDQMECASCHDVHNGYGFDHLLVKDNVGSALCLTCHSK
ncbi:MAG: cytochrome c3 family protein [Bacteroidetes bacterium]|nr:cytochrome c3 family protein [Bacteroidota bacterium]